MTNRMNVKTFRKTGITQGKKAQQARIGAARLAKRAHRNVAPASLRQNIGETKVFEVGFGASVVPNAQLALNTTGSIVCLNMVQIGSTFCNRVGRKLEMMTLQLETRIIGAGNAVTAPLDYARILVVYDRQPNGALPAMADILQSTDQASVNYTNHFSGINMNNRDRFTVLIDKRIELPQAAFAGGVFTAMLPSTFPLQASKAESGMSLNEFRKLGGLVTHYKADSAPGVIGDISTGSLLLVTLGTSAPGAEAYAMVYNTRLKFRDQ